MEQCAQALRRATDHLEAKRLPQGLDELRDAKTHIDLAIEFINKNP